MSEKLNIILMDELKRRIAENLDRERLMEVLTAPND